MIALLIDSSTDFFHLALLKNGKTLYALKRLSEKNMTEFAVQEVWKSLNECALKPNELTDIYVTTGPGSFTSVRIALLIAKTIISKHRNITLWQTSALEFQLGQQDGISLIDAKSNSWYAAIKDHGVTKIIDHVVQEDELRDLLKNNAHLRVYRDLKELDLQKELPSHLKIFQKAEDYKEVVATYIKPAYNKQ